MSDDEVAQTAWNFNDFIELNDQDNQLNQKSNLEKDSLARKIKFYPANASETKDKTINKSVQNSVPKK